MLFFKKFMLSFIAIYDSLMGIIKLKKYLIIIKQINSLINASF